MQDFVNYTFSYTGAIKLCILRNILACHRHVSASISEETIYSVQLVEKGA